MYRSEAASPIKWQSSGQGDRTPNGNKELPSGGTAGTQQTPSTMAPGRRASRKRASLIEKGQEHEEWEHIQKENALMPSSDEDDIRLQKSSLVQSLVSSLLENTGAHGIPNIKRAPNNARKIMWTILFLFGLAMFTWQTSWLLSRYYSYGVDIKMEVSRDTMVEFPAVTICNINPIKSDYLDELIDLGTDLPPGLTGSMKGYEEDLDAEFDSYFVSIDDAVNLVGALRYKDRRATGHLLRDMLLRCRFQGRPCHVRDFTYFYNYLYGNCFIFNVGDSDTNATAVRRFVTKAGPLYGLTMELYIEQDQYSDIIQQAAGARVIVHADHKMPFPEDEGVSISPGQETFIGFKRRNFTRLPYPYSNCTEQGPETIFNVVLPNTRYSQSACENDCYYQNLTRECGCTDARYRYNDSVPLCTSPDQDECSDRVERMYEGGQLDCKCTPPCRELTYEIIPGSARWPNEKFKPFLQESFGNVSEDLERDIDRDGDPNFLEKNVLKVNVYYDTLEYMSIYQDKAYDEIALLSDMGGNVGLWIGVSVLTVFEFIELIYDVCKLVAYRILHKKSMKRKAKVTSSDINLKHVSNITVDQKL